MLSLKEAITASIFISAITFLTRVFPFIVFKVKKPSQTLLIVEKYIPPAIMMMLLIYCIKDIKFLQKPYGFPEIIAIIVAIFVQYKYKNPLISIFGATFLYMFLIHFQHLIHLYWQQPRHQI